MRSVIIAAAVLLAASGAADAAEIRVLTPGVTLNGGLKALAEQYEKQTGVVVKVVPTGMDKIVAQTESGAEPADVVVAAVDLMDTLALDKAIRPGSYTPLGRVEIGLAVKAGAPHPDISTVEKLAATLKSAKAVLYSNPASGSMEAGIIDQMLKRPEFAGVHKVISTKGEGGQALRRGEGDMALQLICEVYPYKDISLVAVLPPQLGAHIDSAAAISARARDPGAAQAFLNYLTSPEATPVWKANGLDRFEAATRQGPVAPADASRP